MTMYSTVMIGIIIYLLGCSSCQCPVGNKCSTSKDSLIPTCYCDEKCLTYQDCCKEYIWSHSTFSSLNSTNREKSFDQACVLIVDPIRNVSNRIGAFMVDKCYAKDKRCLVQEGKLETMVPVTHGPTTYRNAECAICNDVDEFEYWTVVYNVLDEDDVVSFSSTGEFINENNVLKWLQNRYVKEKEYILNPPTENPPRYCPYDVVSSNGAIEAIGAITSYQNVVSCNGFLYKNFEICRINGCCKTNPIECTEYYIPFFFVFESKTSSNLRSSGVVDGGIRVILKFKANDMIHSVKRVAESPQMTYMNIFVPILLKIQRLTTDSFNLNECVHGIIAYFQNTKYKLLPEHTQYYHTAGGQNLYIVYIPFRGSVDLDDEDVNILYRLHQSIWMARQDVKIAHGELNVVSLNDTTKSPFGDLHGRIQSASILKGYVQPRTLEIYPTCDNMSIVFDSERAGSNVFVDAKCMFETLKKDPDHADGSRRIEISLLLFVFALVLSIY